MKKRRKKRSEHIGVNLQIRISRKYLLQPDFIFRNDLNDERVNPAARIFSQNANLRHEMLSRTVEQHKKGQMTVNVQDFNRRIEHVTQILSLRETMAAALTCHLLHTSSIIDYDNIHSPEELHAATEDWRNTDSQVVASSRLLRIGRVEKYQRDLEKFEERIRKTVKNLAIRDPATHIIRSCHLSYNFFDPTESIIQKIRDNPYEVRGNLF